MQLHQPRRLALGQAAAQERPEEVVIAVPVALGLHDEQVRGDQVAQHVAGVRALRDGRRERRREPLEHRRVEQEALELLGKARQHLVGQVVEVRPGGGDVRSPPGAATGPGRQQQPGDPPLGALVQLADLGLEQLPGRVLQQLGGLREAEGEHPLVDDGGPAGGGARGGDAQVAAAGDRQVHVGRQVRRQAPQGVAHRPRVERVDVVERQHEVVGDRDHDLVGEGGHLVVGGAAAAAGPSPRPGRPPQPRRPRAPAASRGCAGAGRTTPTPTAAGSSPAPAPAGWSCRSRPRRRRRAAGPPGRGSRARPAPGGARCWAAAAEAGVACATRRPECSRTARHRARSSSWILGHGGRRADHPIPEGVRTIEFLRKRRLTRDRPGREPAVRAA